MQLMQAPQHIFSQSSCVHAKPSVLLAVVTGGQQDAHVWRELVACVRGGWALCVHTLLTHTLLAPASRCCACSQAEAHSNLALALQAAGQLDLALLYYQVSESETPRV
jgi:hypothetical protein